MLRGGAQPHLIEGADGNVYAVKFRNNPQHRRVLINEFICSNLLCHLGISTPDIALIEIEEKFIRCNPQMYLQLVGGRGLVQAGIHFGSRYPMDPEKVAIYDFLPDAMLTMVENRTDFMGALVFDKWVSNTDARQAVFCRGIGTDEQWPNTYRVFMIDHGFAFNGGDWNYITSSVQGIYSQKVVYESVAGLRHFQPWLARIIDFPPAIIEEILRQIPREWLEKEDRVPLEKLIRALIRRRRRVGDLIEDCTRTKVNPFSKWREGTPV